MGACASVAGGGTDGDNQAFTSRFEVDRVLGEGEFGQVKLVHEKDGSKKDFACKTLRKGPVFKDNTLYPALPSEVLRGEIEMLQVLKGKHFCMNLVAVYETPRAILMVTDCYMGGEMMEYVSKQPEDLRVEDVSRIAFQLLSAVDHCAKNNVLHRDIKPENTMFLTTDPGAELRLIDFGSGTNRVVEGNHTTFAGTPFYNSPEMFQKTYTSKTDVWSVGVVLYVLVAGYPSDALQKAFNILLDSKRTNLKSLPNMPDDMPESYHEMLEQLLKYSQKSRKSAGDILDCDFVKFHDDLKAEQADAVPDLAPAAASARASRLKRTSSIALRGSVQRHSMFLDFRTFERSITAILATMLEPEELSKLVEVLASQAKDKNLETVTVLDLKETLEEDIKNEACLGILENTQTSPLYDSYAYHYYLLKPFVEDDLRSAKLTANGNGHATPSASAVAKAAPARKSLMESKDPRLIGASFHAGKSADVRFQKPNMRRRMTVTNLSYL